MAKILIIEDEQSIRNVLRSILQEQDASYEISEAPEGASGLEAVRQKDFDAVLCDVKMPKMDGMEVLEQAMALKPETPFIMISGHGDIETAVQSLKKGAFDFLAKPPDLNRLLTSVRHAIDQKQLLNANESLHLENKRLRKKVSQSYELVGASTTLEEVKAVIEKVAPTDARVLIAGPNGTGKELVAHWIHEKSARNQAPLVAVNCAAIPSELIESELFGHEKGSFTGAFKQKKGKFEEAHKRTLFLDEIGDMSLSAQAKVLRVLQEGCITRVGGDKPIPVDVRVLAATNKDLKAEIQQGRFREDLYHRLAVILIEVPPLNARAEDIPLLAAHFSSQIAKLQGLKKKKFSPEALKRLKTYPWTGNIRELRNAVERLLILGGDPISVEDVASYVGKSM